ncbi:MAG: YceI family protein [Holophaga sp.]|jgi:polyisoprenoid-binding protein YceI
MTGFTPRLLSAVLLGLSVPLLAAQAPATTPATAAAPAAVEDYVIDPVHTTAQFNVAHMLISTVTGKFDQVKGTIHLDPANLARSSVEVTIDVSSVNTGNATRDKDLVSPNYFDAAKYPNITFKSTEVKDLGGGALSVAGTLTIHGETKPVVIAVTGWSTGPGMKPGSKAAGFRKGTLTLKRSEYGMSHLIGPIGDEVDINLSVEANKVQPAQ